MSPDDWRRVKEIAGEALSQPEDERAAYVGTRCVDESTRREVLSLIDAIAKSSDLYEAPAFSSAGALAVIAEAENCERSLIGRRIGAYRIVDELGRGGMGVVYVAERADQAYQKRVAIKLIKRGMDTDAILRRFQTERQILANLDHPNIARLFDAGTTDDGLPYFIMEYVDGLPIDTFCDRRQFSIRDRLELFRNVCEALQYAHDNRIVHCDLKPGNVLVTTGGTPKLLDFGIAKLLGSGDQPRTVDTGTLARAMTPQYASPEQLRGEPTTPASDVYSLGVLLYVLLTGRLPIRLEGRTPAEIQQAVCVDEPPAPSAQSQAALGDLNRDLDTIVLKALEKDPKRRYPTAKALADDIGRCLNGVPVLTRRAGAGKWLWTVLSTRRAPATRYVITAALTIALVVAGLFLTRPSRTVTGRVTPHALQIRSIAVLPLVNLSSDPAQEYFSDGLTDELIMRIAQIGSLRVISRTSVMGFKHSSKKAPEIGAELHVDAIVEGAVERQSDRVRIRVQLIDAATDQHVWAESYDRDAGDVLQLENEVAREIAQQIGQLIVEPDAKQAQVHLVPKEAHEEYLKGRYLWSERSEPTLRSAIEHFKKAIAMDPQYAQAYAGLADSYIILENWGFVSSADAYPLAEAAARKAVALDDRLAEAHTSLGYARFLFDRDWPGAESRFRRALELNPNYSTAHHFYSVYLMAAGRHAEAQREIEHARDLDPLSPATNGVASWIYYEGRSYTKALEQCRRTIEMNPAYAPSRLDLGGVYMATREYEKAIAEFRRAQEIAGDTPAVRSYLAQGYALSGNKPEARRLLHGLLASRFVSPWELALIYDALGDKDQALTSLEQAADDRASWIVIMAVDPRLDDLHDHPRFKDLLRRVHIPQAGSATGSRRAETLPNR